MQGDMGGKCVDKDALLHRLHQMDIDFYTVDHPEVFTVEQALPYVSHLNGTFAKNLFLKDKKKKLWLFCAAHDSDIKLNDLSKMVSAPGGLRFADEETLIEKLGVTQGAVTLFALINDKDHEVKLILDSKLLDGSSPRIYFHPMVNTASTGISSDDLKKFLQHTEHEPIVIDCDSAK